MQAPRIGRLVVGMALIAVGAWLVWSPRVVAEALGRPHEMSTLMINLRASWGGTLVGLGAFLAWLPAMRPWARTVVGLVLWAMVGIGIARTVGFVVDGNPDALQWVWLSAEIVIAGACVVGLRVLANRAAKRATAASSDAR